MADQIKNIVSNLRKREPRTDLQEAVFSRKPPQAIELEEAVLGAIMLEKNALPIVMEILRPQSFYVEAHKKIYEAILELFANTKPVDILTVTDALRTKGVLEEAGGAYYLIELTNKVSSSAHVEYHSRIIAQKFIQRELISVSSEVIKEAFEDTTDVFELLDKTEQNLYEITEMNMRSSYSKMNELVVKAMLQIEELKKNENKFTGVPSGFTELDRITNGWQNSDLIIVAARPSMGKTAFTLSIARNAALLHKKGVAFFSMEMSALQLVNRLISSEAEIESEKIRRGNLAEHEWIQVQKKVEALSAAPIFIDDTAGLNIFELRAKCRRLKQQYNIELIVIDYLQLMTSGTSGNRSGNREQEISSISRALKGIAKELDIPVIALSQLSRAVESRGGDKKPMLSDLRESGAIEQDADIVAFLHRPEYYGQVEDENGNSTKGIAEVIIAKHRNGALGSVKTKFINQFAKFADLNPFEMNNYGTFGVDAPTQRDTPNLGIITRSSRMNDTESGKEDDILPWE
jgi:replicative DNA helicase